MAKSALAPTDRPTCGEPEPKVSGTESAVCGVSARAVSPEFLSADEVAAVTDRPLPLSGSGPPSYNFITDRLAIGDVNARTVPGWQAIVSVLATTPWDEQCGAPTTEEGVPVFMVDVMDGHAGLDLHLGPACAFIMQHIKHGCVLVHCGVGRSRSVSLVAAYLCRYAGMSLDQALGLIARRRPNICPWDGFKREITGWLKLDQLAAKGPRP